MSCIKLLFTTLVLIYEGEIQLIGPNRPLPSCLNPLFPSESKCKAIDMEMIFYSHANKIHFHNKGFAPGLVLKVKFLELGSGLSTGLTRLKAVSRAVT